MNRRDLMVRSLALGAYLAAPRALAGATPLGTGQEHGPLGELPQTLAEAGNFRRVYLDPALRDRFYLFLQNVFHLYPEDRMHQLIIDLTAAHATDREIYDALQAQIPEIKPLFSELSYAIPALQKQKREMARQTMAFLGEDRSVRGYLEIGSTGRYVGELEHHLSIDGPIYIVNDIAPSFSPTDMLERGQLTKIGSFVQMGDYDAFGPNRIADDSVDLVTNFIGFHHCPEAQLEGFVRSIHRVMRPEGRLIVRDHDVDSQDMETLVGLAHDVFNAGVWLSWEENHRQIRRFRSMAALTTYLSAAGFVRSERTLAQEHDPTQNLLAEFVKV